MILETARLKIIPLTLEQFDLLLHGMDELEKEMGWIDSGKSLDAEVQQAMEMLYHEALLHPGHYEWYTNWQIVLKAENKSIGSMCFMKEPDRVGQVEIGYGMNEEYRNRGYMTEAVIRLCQWAFQQENVRTVIAETEVDNYGSQRVLEKSGMVRYGFTDHSIYWKIMR